MLTNLSNHKMTLYEKMKRSIDHTSVSIHESLQAKLQKTSSSTNSRSNMPSMTTTTTTTTPLPIDFKPAPYTVIVGRGKEPKENIGNKRLRVMVKSYVEKYTHATDRRTKTRIVTSIVKSVRSCPGGMFVKHAKNGRWYEVNDAVAREKVGYIFRDVLGDRYLSSSKSKVARRQQELMFYKFHQESPIFSNAHSAENINAIREKTPELRGLDMEPIDRFHPIELANEIFKMGYPPQLFNFEV